MRQIPLILLSVAGLAAEDWKAPADAAAATSPVASSAATIEAGKAVYVQNCLSCHGATGKGDGEAAAYMTPRPASLGSPAIAAQSDGAFFWKISTGRGLMPPWKPVLTDEQRWQVVAYLRTLSPKAAAPAPAK